MKSTEFLQAAIDVQAERGVTYDKPSGERSMGATVTAFNAITGRDLSEAEGWLLLQVLKDVRQWQNPSKYHHDSALDGVAYSALKAEALSEEQQEDHGWCGDDPRKEPSHIISDIPGEWIEWNGGQCPVEEGTIIDVKDFDGEINERVEAITHWSNLHMHWEHRCATDCRIIAYRLSPTSTTK